jgi:hypothetical protein
MTPVMARNLLGAWGFVQRTGRGLEGGACVMAQLRRGIRMEPGRVTTTAAASENPGGGVSRVAYEGLPDVLCPV